LVKRLKKLYHSLIDARNEADITSSARPPADDELT